VTVYNHRQLFAWQLAEEFKGEVFAIVAECRRISEQPRFRSQLVESARAVAKDIAEGFDRCSPGDFARLLDCGIGSLGEAAGHLHDGIELGFFAKARCATAFRLVPRCRAAMIALKRTQLRYRAEQQKTRRQPLKPAKPDRIAERQFSNDDY
jgi:four helix bundle protein